VCQWRGKDDHGIVYCCSNEPLFDEHKRGFTRVCAYHTKVCVAVHVDGAFPLQYPNDQAKCVMHYRSDNGVLPTCYASEMNSPGVIMLRAATARHPMAPTTEPPPEVTRAQKAAMDAAAARAANAAKHAKSMSEDALMAASVRVVDPALLAALADRPGGAELVPAAAVVAPPSPVDVATGSGTQRVVRQSNMELARSRAAKLVARAALPTMRTLRHVLPARVTATLSAAAGLDVAEVKEGDAAERVAAEAVRVSGVPATVRARAQRQAYENPLTREKYELAATVIQALVRRHIARRAVQRMRDIRLRAARNDAAVIVQRALRTAAARRNFRAMFMRHTDAAIVIQRAFRMWRYHTAVELKRRLGRAAIAIQKWWRVVRLQYHLHLLHDAASAGAAAVIESRAIASVRRLVRNYRLRGFIRGMLRRTREVSDAVTLLSRKFRAVRHRTATVGSALVGGSSGRPGRRPVTRRDEWLANEAVYKINSWWRRLRMKWEARFDRQTIIHTVVHVQRLARGFLARNRVRAMLLRRDATRAFLAPGLTRTQVNRLLGGEAPAGGATLASGGAGTRPLTLSLTAAATGTRAARLALPASSSASSSVVVAAAAASATTGSTVGGAAAAAAAATSPPRGARGAAASPPKHSASAVAAAVNKLRHNRKLRVPVLGGTQTVSDEARDTDPDFLKIKAHVDRLEAAFMANDKYQHGYVPRAAFGRVLAASGFAAAPALRIKLQNLFLAAGDMVDYRSYIAFARQLRYLCPIHKVLVCPVCLFTGSCEACTCTSYKPDPAFTASIYHRRAGICECGHHQRRHLPGMVVHSETTVPAPDPLVLRLTLPRVSSLAREACGGLTNTTAEAERAANEAFRSTLATDQAPVYEELAAELSLNATGLRSLEAAALAKAEREALATRAAIPVLTPAQRRAKATAERQERVAAAVSKKWTSLDVWMDSVADTVSREEAEVAAARAAEDVASAIPPPTEEELALYKDDADLAAHLPGMSLYLQRAAATATASPSVSPPASPRAEPAGGAGSKKGVAAMLATVAAAKVAAAERAATTVPADVFVLDGEDAAQRTARLAAEADAAADAEARLRATGAVLVRPPKAALGNKRVLATLARVRDDIHEVASVRALATSTLRYWSMFLRLAYPDDDGRDVVGDEHAMTDLLFHAYDFLARWWVDLVNDLRRGKLEGGPPGLTLPQRRLMEAGMVPDVGRATILEQVFRAVRSAALCIPCLPSIVSPRRIPPPPPPPPPGPPGGPWAGGPGGRRGGGSSPPAPPASLPPPPPPPLPPLMVRPHDLATAAGASTDSSDTLREEE